VNHYEVANELQKKSISFVVCTLLKVQGHAPQDPGAKAIVTEDGLYWGTVGGGKVEARAIEYAKKLILKNDPSIPLVERWNLQTDVGMSCGGAVELLFEKQSSPSWVIAIFGAGHIAQALVRVLALLEAQILCIDNRQEWLEKLPKEQKNLRIIFSDDLPMAIHQVPNHAQCVVMTRGHATDLPVLQKLSQQAQRPYIGVIGSRIKALKIKKDLLSLGVDSSFVHQLHSPMGLSIGNTNQPAEIAVSICAELIQTRALLLKKPLSKHDPKHRLSLENNL